MSERNVDAISRFGTFVGVHNFRDYGGYRTADGYLRRSMLFRSGHHADATDVDLGEMARLKFRAVIDLRGPSERNAAPCRWPEGFDAVGACVKEDNVRFAPHVAASRAAMTPAEARDALRRTYEALVTGRRMRGVLRRYFELLATVEGPSLIYCTAGKDRTGFGVALLHRLMGVHRDDLFADYLLTNRPEGSEARLASGAQAMRDAFGVTLPPDTLAELMAVREEYLVSAFDKIDEEFGSFEQYAIDALGVTAERHMAIRQRLTA